MNISEDNLKLCTECNSLKELKDFNKNNRKKDGLQSFCKICDAKNSRDYYAKNSEHHKNVTTKRKKKCILESKKFIYTYLLSHPCIDCGEKDPIVLEFDHIKGIKTGCISRLVHIGCSIKRIQREIDICVVRCANCHRRKTAKDFYWELQLE
ncbi:hypothetical protein UFOVP1290_359 [uncultured Caudovirales phage]|uniref:HNHc domain containing protein n=1 Tax=uncultured Caudovirales phage TaxID=2100421 RepID=A0A6J5RIM3_9CAUD|nr:hypothetical protein UFOVP1290_359 [uncultured Caudovirales phage]